MKVGISGMDRVGRLALRAAMGGVPRANGDPRASNRLNVVHVNENKSGIYYAANAIGRLGGILVPGATIRRPV